jgi:hypothetical protein
MLMQPTIGSMGGHYFCSCDVPLLMLDCEVVKVLSLTLDCVDKAGNVDKAACTYAQPTLMEGLFTRRHSPIVALLIMQQPSVGSVQRVGKLIWLLYSIDLVHPAWSGKYNVAHGEHAN